MISYIEMHCQQNTGFGIIAFVGEP